MLLSDMYSFVRDDSTGTNVVSRGLSLALNNSWAANVEPMKEEAYKFLEGLKAPYVLKR